MSIRTFLPSYLDWFWYLKDTALQNLPSGLLSTKDIQTLTSTQDFNTIHHFLTHKAPIYAYSSSPTKNLWHSSGFDSLTGFSTNLAYILDNIVKLSYNQDLATHYQQRLLVFSTALASKIIDPSNPLIQLLASGLTFEEAKLSLEVLD